ncbi:MAG: 4Fe-4S dicluster domain-containing protein [Sandaracinaceae bacterium]|nr:4Fe-4S dicluster domain-containing protein [Sandaracinaceae bacterium]
MSNPNDERPTIWRSLAEKVDPRRRDRLAAEETGIQVGSLLPEKSLVDRRTFLSIAGASAATVGLSGCLRRPEEQILPYTVQPEYSQPGIPLHFATSTNHRGEGIGLLVESHEGRPTKIEGNPSHAMTGGKTDAHLQARILDLYDDERASDPRRGEDAATWAEFYAWWREKAASLGTGAGLRVLMPPTPSPTMDRVRRAFAERFPAARVHTWSAIPEESARRGTAVAFNSPRVPVYDLGGDARNGPRARVIASFDCDFLAGERGFLHHARGFARGRDIRAPEQPMNRLYALEGTLSVTGMNADHRLRLAPSQIDRTLRGLAAKLATLPGVAMPPAVGRAVEGAFEGLPEAHRTWIERMARDLASNTTRSLVCVGWRQPFHVHALAAAINVALGNSGATVHYYPEPDSAERQGLAELVEAMRGGLDTLVILGGNPVYDAPGDLDFAAALGSVQNSVHLSMRADETSSACSWHLPMAHELESWGDYYAIDGTYSLQQPLIAPLRRGVAAQELFAFIAGIRAFRGYNLVRNTLRERVGEVGFERRWRRSLHAGVVDLPLQRPRPPALQDSEVATALGTNEPAAPGGWEAVFIPSYQTWDGSEAHNPWLLELPDPVTKVVWGNAAYISPHSATELGLLNDGDFSRHEYEGSFPSGWMLDITTGAGTVSIPAIVVPGHADEVVTLPLGFGRTAAGRHGTGVGVNVRAVRASDSLGFATGAQVRPGTGRELVVQTQDHHSMTTITGDRPLAIDATYAQYQATPDFAQWREPSPSLSPLWTQEDYNAPRQPAQGGRTYQPFPTPRSARPDAPPRYKWGMVLDLTTCTGCSACIIACQAENNISVVGKRQVALGREMHWMRLDRYFVGDDINEPRVALQPVGCQHCEEAPCENVCPVAATAHSPEGLNDMAYNRCIGTRYCQNNCPYKVRRFNFLDWHGHIPEIQRMVFNPNVSIRIRGVMEKCSYCVQRIQAARIAARRETTVEVGDDPDSGRLRGRINERRIRPDEIQSACSQACPSNAIYFGDFNDTESEVHRMSRLDRRYSLIASVGTQPRTVYLGKIRNPNPEMV